MSEEDPLSEACMILCALCGTLSLNGLNVLLDFDPELAAKLTPEEIDELPDLLRQTVQQAHFFVKKHRPEFIEEGTGPVDDPGERG